MSTVHTCLVLVVVSAIAGAGGSVFVVDDSDGVAAGLNAPLTRSLKLQPEFQTAAAASRLWLQTADGRVPAQYETGRLWWRMPAGEPGLRRLELVVGDPAATVMRVESEAAGQQELILDGDRPVLAYQVGTVPVPSHSTGKYAVARSNYVHPLYDLDGVVLTADFPEHAHHRGIYWAWPEVSYAGETRDLHALQGVFARDVQVRRRQAGPVFAQIDAECLWKWGDKEPIVHEAVVIRAFARHQGRRPVDFEFAFRALKPGVTVARRGRDKYGGLNIRLAKLEQQAIRTSRNWGLIAGIPPGGQAPSALSIFQHSANPRYPGDWIDYPKIDWLQPTFPAAGEAYPLSQTAPLKLAYRIWILADLPDDALLDKLWTAYNGLREPRFASLAGYSFGDSRKPLLAVEAQIQTASAGERRQIERDLAQLLVAPDRSLDVGRWVCRQLARIGSDRSVPALASAASNPDLRDAACRALQAIPGPASDAALQALLPKSPAKPAVTDSVTFRVALMALARSEPVRGREAVRDALSSKDLAHQLAAVHAIRVLPKQPGAAWATAIPTLEPTAQVALIYALAERGDPALTPIAMQLAASPRPAVQAAALTALGRSDSAAVVDRLAEFATNPSARQSLEQLALPGVGPRLQALAIAAAPEQAKALIDIMKLRGDPDSVTALLTLAKRPDRGVASDAISAIGLLADTQDLTGIIELYRSTTGATQDRVGRALAAVCACSAKGGACVKLLAEHLPGPSLVELLPSIGGAAALAALDAALASDDPTLRDAAHRAASKWQSRDGLPMLEGILRDTDDERHRILALRAMVRLASKNDDEQAQLILQRARALARTDRERGVLP